MSAKLTLTEVIKQSIQSNSYMVNVESNNVEKKLTYLELFKKALSVLACLQSRGVKPLDKVIIIVDDNPTLLVYFWACILGKFIPVPVTDSYNDEHRLKLLNIWQILDKPFLVTTQKILNSFVNFLTQRNLFTIIESIQKTVILTEEPIDYNREGIIANIRPQDTAYIQFSSGTTGNSKGIIVSHENLLTNINAIIKRINLSKEDSWMGWLPLSHDMGLIGCHLVPLTFAINQYLMPTSLFIRHTALWMQKAYEHKISILSSSNFGLDYFLSFYNREVSKDWDLSAVRLIFNGSEVIDPVLIERFCTEMATFKLKETALYPVYGLAEATLAVSFPQPGENTRTINIDRTQLNMGQEIHILPTHHEDSLPLVSVGYPLDGCRVRIVDGNNQALQDHIIGYIQIKGKNVTCGYFNNEEATKKTCSPDGWFTTGDLGFINNGELFILGRASEIINVNGHFYLPQDLEKLAEEITHIQTRKITICGIFNPQLQSDEVVVFLANKEKDFPQVAKSLEMYIYNKLHLKIRDVVAVNQIPKTTSGKIQRYRLKENYLKEMQHC